MPKRILITLAIIVGIGAGFGALVFGVLIMMFGNAKEGPCTIIGIGSAILAASIAALVAHLNGGFRELDDRDGF
jgi:hypothetical protein